MTVDTICVNGEIKRCPTCHLVKDGKISEENFPLDLLDEIEPKVWYCKICGFLYVIDEDECLDGIININEKLLFPKLRSIVFGLDTSLHKSITDILTEIREDEHLYDKNRKLCAVNEHMLISNTEVKKIKKNIVSEVFKIFDTISKQEKDKFPPGYTPEKYINDVKVSINDYIDREIV